MRILLTGKNGQVGWELRRTLATLGEVFATDKGQLDLRDADAIRQWVREHRPQVIVNPAAYTTVDEAESDEETAHRVNALAPAILAEEAKHTGALLVHFSTDYVFDGTAKKPYFETDRAAPLGAYGRTKLAGEDAVRASGCKYLILRSSWIYAGRGKNFVLTMLRLAREGRDVRVVDDQIGAPTWARSIAEAAALAVAKSVRVERGCVAVDENRLGVFHLSASGSTTWYGFARKIFELAETNGLPRPNSLSPISIAQYPTPAKRPLYSVLDCTRFHAAFGLRLPAWYAALDLCMEDLAAAEASLR